MHPRKLLHAFAICSAGAIVTAAAPAAADSGCGEDVRTPSGAECVTDSGLTATTKVDSPVVVDNRHLLFRGMTLNISGAKDCRPGTKAGCWVQFVDPVDGQQAYGTESPASIHVFWARGITTYQVNCDCLVQQVGPN